MSNDYSGIATGMMVAGPHISLNVYVVYSSNTMIVPSWASTWYRYV